MDPRYKKWQIYYVIQQLRGAAPSDDNITVLYSSFDLKPEFVDAHISDFDRREIIVIKGVLKGRGYIIRLSNKNKFEEEYEVANKSNEERVVEYDYKQSGLKPHFKGLGILYIGPKTSVFDKDTQIYELCHYMVSNGLGKSYEGEELWVHLNNSNRPILEPTKKDIFSIRYVVRRLNKKLRNDFGVGEDFFVFKGKQVVFRPEILTKTQGTI